MRQGLCRRSERSHAEARDWEELFRRPSAGKDRRGRATPSEVPSIGPLSPCSQPAPANQPTQPVPATAPSHRPSTPPSSPLAPGPSSAGASAGRARTTASHREETSDGCNRRHSPGWSPKLATGPMRVRAKLTTCCPTASHMRLIWRLRPSCITIRRALGPRTLTRAGAVNPSSRWTPLRNLATASRGTLPATLTTYSFSTPKRGWASL